MNCLGKWPELESAVFIEETQSLGNNSTLDQVASKGSQEGGGYSSGIGLLPSMWNALGLIPSTTKSTK